MKKRTRKTLRKGDKFRVLYNQEQHGKGVGQTPFIVSLPLAMEVEDMYTTYSIPIGSIVIIDKIKQTHIVWHIEDKEDKPYMSFWCVFKECTEFIEESLIINKNKKQ